MAAPLVAPPAGLIIYNTATAGLSPNNVIPGYYYWDGAKWVLILTGSAANGTAWTILGNAGTNPATNFLGTTDPQPLELRANNQKSGYIDYNVANANTSLGYQAINSTTGAGNSAVGFQALFSNTSGGTNTAEGYQALYTNTTAGGSTAFGYQASYTDNSGFNTAVGYQSLKLNTAAPNVAVGYQTLTNNSTGNWNTAEGYQALFANTTGITNTAFGGNALRNNTGASWNTAVGYGSLSGANTGTANTAMGPSTLGSNTSGVANVAIGYGDLLTNSTGSWNTALGAQALWNNTGSNNIGVGGNALFTNTSGFQNLAVGISALSANTAGNNNIAIGLNALVTNSTGSTNLAVGFQALNLNTVSNNEAVGYQALFNNSTGTPNTAIGFQSQSNTTTGTNNVSLGDASMTTNTVGSQNTAIGSAANVAANNLNNTTALGYQASATASNSMVFGNHSVTQFQFNGAFMPYYGAAYNAGAAGQELISQGPGVAPQWGTATTTTTAWQLLGNTGTNPAINFVGTTDNNPLILKTFNAEGIRITSSGVSGTPGLVGIGNITPQQNLSVNNAENIDQANLNNGFLNNGSTTGNGLTFGLSSGEGIASKRTGGGNQFGLDFYTNFTNRMVITNGGNVGIGTTAPGAKLHVIAAGGFGSEPIRAQSGSTFFSGVDAGGIQRYAINNDAGPTLNFYGWDAGWFNYMSVVETGSKAVYFNAGNVGIGTAAPAYPLTVQATVINSCNNYEYISQTTTGHIAGNSGNVPISIYSVGRIICASEIDVTSDKRLKDTVDHISPEFALAAITKLRPVHFYWKKEVSKDQNEVAGFYAQEVHSIIPEAVTIMPGVHFKDEHTLNYDMLTTYAIGAIQQQQKLIESQKTVAETQQATIEELRKEIEILKKQVADLVPATSTETAAVKK